MENYLAAGGEILALSSPAAYVDGRPSDRVQALATRYASQWHAVANQDELLPAIRTRLQPRIEFDRPLPSGVGFAERVLENGERVLFFTNTGTAAVRANAMTEGGALETWDTISGRTRAASFTSEGGRLRFALDLAPAGSALFVVKKTGAAAPPDQARGYAPLAAAHWSVTPEAPNVLVLDYCDLQLAGAEQRDLNTWRANWNIWQAHGFERPAWDNAVQFKSHVFDQNHFDAASGFEATFHFEVTDPAARKGMQLAIESPELYQVTVNGSPVSFRQATRWLDPHISSASIEKLAKTGDNTVTIVAHPFHVKMELEPIYIRGNFSVAAAGKGFRIGAPVQLAFGSWAKQGYAFYGAAALYKTAIEVPAGATRLRVELGAWQGSVAEVLLDGKRAAVLGWQPYTAEFAASPGKHAVAVRIVSTPRNIFGPFHHPRNPGKAQGPRRG